ncbi:hypothetical protein AWB73_05831 [Caballeronia turbans]|nr:hypothetical protein AWB73_05831 [Caballeronia turbans]
MSSNQYVTPIKLVLFTLLLLFFALFALWRRRRFQIAIIVAALAWAVGSGWLATPLLDLAQHGYRHTDVPTFAPRTTMVLMGGGTARSEGGLVPQFNAMRRIDAIGMLYRECRETGASCKVILSGGDPQRHGQAEADNYAPYVLAQGVAPDDLVRENQSLNTYQNARNVADILGPAHDNRLIVVTSAYHMRRALRAFEAFGYAPVPYVSDVRPNRVTLFPRIRGFANSELAMHELVGLARFDVYRWLHLY